MMRSKPSLRKGVPSEVSLPSLKVSRAGNTSVNTTLWLMSQKQMVC